MTSDQAKTSPPSPSPLLPTKPKNSCPNPHNQTECTAIYFYAFTTFLLLIAIQSLAIRQSTSTDGPAFPQTPTLLTLTFHPLLDPFVPPYKDPTRTWFMSALTGRPAGGFPEHFVFPSRHRPFILCIDARNKSYALGAAANAFPSGSAPARGLTFVADSFYDYENPWHGLNAVAPFLAWAREEQRRRERPRPARFVLFKKGEVVRRVGRWTRGVLRATLGEEAEVDGMGVGRGVKCFETAVVMRRGLGGMDGRRRKEVFEMVRCRAWEYCGCRERREETGKEVRISLVGRRGKIRFRNESLVKEVISRECRKVSGCQLRVVQFDNMSFCDQVRVMRNTDILTSIHGTQLTNMMFMPKGSSVMEMFPTGWLEGARVGQFIYKWFSDWSQMSYEGTWRDPPSGWKCTKPPKQECFVQQKDQSVGVNETYLANWIALVIRLNIARKDTDEYHLSSHNCSF